MTKAKALELMLRHSREVVDPALTRKIAKAFGTTLKELGVGIKKVKDFPRLNYGPGTGELTAVSMHNFARELAQKLTGVRVSTGMHGIGSGAQDITEKAVTEIKKKSGYISVGELEKGLSAAMNRVVGN